MLVSRSVSSFNNAPPTVKWEGKTKIADQGNLFLLMELFTYRTIPTKFLTTMQSNRQPVERTFTSTDNNFLPLTSNFKETIDSLFLLLSGTVYSHNNSFKKWA